MTSSIMHQQVHFAKRSGGRMAGGPADMSVLAGQKEQAEGQWASVRCVRDGVIVLAS